MIIDVLMYMHAHAYLYAGDEMKMEKKYGDPCPT